MSVDVSMLVEFSFGPIERRVLRKRLNRVTGLNWTDGDLDLDLSANGLFRFESSDLTYSLIVFSNLATIDSTNSWASFYGIPVQREAQLQMLGRVANAFGDGTVLVHPDRFAIASELTQNPNRTFEGISNELSALYRRERAFDRVQECFEQDLPLDIDFYFQLKVDSAGGIMSYDG